MRCDRIWALLLACAWSYSASACATDDCERKRCAELGDGKLETNGKSYTKCYLGTDPLETSLEDEQGKVFFRCTDSPSHSCLAPSVDAMFAYCGARVR